MTFVTVVLALLVVALIVEVLRLRAQLHELRWTDARIIPLMRQAAREDPDNRAYLDPEILHAFARGDLTIDQAVVLSKQPAPHH